MTTQMFGLGVSEGLGQLEAYIGAEEGVAFEMDNKLIWVSVGRGYNVPVHGLPDKTERSKFMVTSLPSGEVMLRDWTNTYLAPLPPSVDPYTYPLRLAPDLSHEDAALHFEVFYRDNKVAFRAYNGLFLTRVDRGYHAVEAAKQVADESCCFRPIIGDICMPTFQISRVTDLSVVKCDPCVLRRERHTNSSNKPKSHTFSMTWEADVTDRVAWKHLWGLGLAISHTVRISGMRATLKYTEDNEKVVSVTRRICESHARQVVIPPKSVCTASFLVNKNDNAVFTFNAVIREEKCNGHAMLLHQPGAWTGLVYNDVHLDVEMERIWGPCNIL